MRAADGAGEGAAMAPPIPRVALSIAVDEDTRPPAKGPSAAADSSVSCSARVSLRVRDVRELRDEANVLYRADRIFDSLELYSECIRLEPCAALYCNRTLAWMAVARDARVRAQPDGLRRGWRSEGLKAALLDVSRGAVKHDPACAKAFHLAGSIRIKQAELDTHLSLKERHVALEVAVETLEKAAELAPGDGAVARRLQEAVDACTRMHRAEAEGYRATHVSGTDPPDTGDAAAVI